MSWWVARVHKIKKEKSDSYLAFAFCILLYENSDNSGNCGFENAGTNEREAISEVASQIANRLSGYCSEIICDQISRLWSSLKVTSVVGTHTALLTLWAPMCSVSLYASWALNLEAEGI